LNSASAHPGAVFVEAFAMGISSCKHQHPERQLRSLNGLSVHLEGAQRAHLARDRHLSKPTSSPSNIAPFLLYWEGRKASYNSDDIPGTVHLRAYRPHTRGIATSCSAPLPHCQWPPLAL
jgi:hypothetical protein